MARTPNRALLVIVFLGPAVGLGGCYESHVRDSEGTDAGRRDVGTTPDGSRPPDSVGIDGGSDTVVTLDGGFDAGPDVEPEEMPPPEPGRCRLDPVIEPFSAPVLEYRWPDSEVVRGDAVHVCVTPLVIDMVPEAGTIQPELVFVSYSTLGRFEGPGVLRIVQPKTGETISYPPDEEGIGVLEATGNLAAGDLDGDGENEVVGFGVDSGTYAFNADGTLFWESPYPTAVERGLMNMRTIGGAPTIADLEGDGIVEVIAGRTLLDGATGNQRWTGAAGTAKGNNQFLGPLTCAADLTGNGQMEAIVGHTAFSADGRVVWNNPSAQDGPCAVAEVVSASAGPEVILVSRGYVRMLAGRTGEILWSRQLEGRVRLSIGGAPTAADFDGDGNVEFGVAHGSAYGVYDPDCSETPRPARCEGDGVLWTRPSDDSSSSGTGSSVFDFNGDGRAEVVYNDQSWFRVYDGVTGRTMFEHRNSSRTRTENPSIADVDNDGDAEIIFAANAEAFFVREAWTDPGVEVWGDARGRWVGARRIWNQHGYHITNVEENGQIPRGEVNSWEGENSYRQNLREDGDVLATPDLWSGHGEYECTAANQARIHINVTNWGLERVGAGVRVALFYRDPRYGEQIAETRTTRTLEARGDSERVTFDVTLRGDRESYWAVLDPDGELGSGVVAECREDNNWAVVWRPECP